MRYLREMRDEGWEWDGNEMGMRWEWDEKYLIEDRWESCDRNKYRAGFLLIS